MKRMAVVLAAAVLLVLTTAAFAFMGPGRGAMGAGWMSGPMGGGMMGPGMMTGPGGIRGAAGCPGWTTAAVPPAIDEEKAKGLAQEYADTHLEGYTVEKILPFTGRHGTMYSVELTRPDGELRVLHVNPFGEVIPFGGPWRRGA